MRSVDALRVLNAAALGALYVALVQRTGPLSTTYRGALAMGAAVLVVAILAAVGRRPMARWISTPALGDARVRAGFAVAPWIAVAAAVTFGGAWWLRQPEVLRLFVAYTLAAWGVVWCTARPARRPAEVEATPELVRRLLAGIAAVVMACGINGLAFGLTPFGVTTSAWLAVAASAMGAAAFLARPAMCRNLLAASVSALLGLVCVEAGLRVLRIGESVLEVNDAEYVRRFHHMPPPGSAFLNSPNALDEFPPALIEINRQGIRGPEVPSGPVDLLLIGDSFIEARQLAWEQTIGAQLASAFVKRSSSIRVVSHGVRGWSPLLEWNWYLKAGRTLRPKTVLLFFFWNDLWSRGGEAETFRAVMRADGRPDYFDVPVEPAWVWYRHVRTMRLVEDVRQHADFSAVRRSLITAPAPSALDRTGAEALARRMAGDALLSPREVDALLTQPLADLSPALQAVALREFWPGIRPMALWTEEQRRAARSAERELELFAEDVARDGGRLVVVYVPNAYQIAPSECSVGRYLVGLDGDRLLPADSGIQSWLRSVGDRHRIEVLDPSEAMRAYHRPGPGARGAMAEPLHLRADCHWSPRGHQFMADFLADWYAHVSAPR